MRNHATVGNAGVFALVFALVFGGTVLVAPPTYAAARPTITVSPTEALVGDTIVLSGKARARKGKRVWIQMKSGGSWTKIAKTRVRAGKKYKKKVRFAAPGEKVLRVKVVGKRATLKQKVRIYKWRDISNEDRTDYSSAGGIFSSYAGKFDDAGPQYTNGTYTARTIQAEGRTGSSTLGAAGWSDYSLQRKCVEFRAVVGLDDDSKFGTYELVTILGDGVSKYQRTLTNDQSDDVVIDVRGVLRLRLYHERQPPTPGSGSMAVNVGNPQAKCLY